MSAFNTIAKLIEKIEEAKHVRYSESKIHNTFSKESDDAFKYCLDILNGELENTPFNEPETLPPTITKEGLHEAISLILQQENAILGRKISKLQSILKDQCEKLRQHREAIQDIEYKMKDAEPSNYEENDYNAGINEGLHIAYNVVKKGIIEEGKDE